jgi:aminopeptidase N
MRTILTLAILLLFAGQALNGQNSQFNSGAEFCHYKKVNGTSIDSPKGQMAAAPHTFDVLDYKLSLDLTSNYSTPFPTAFQASVIIKFKIDTALNSIKLNAVNSSLLIDSVRLAGINYTHSGNFLTIELDRTYEPGENAEVKIYYHHKNVEDGAIYCTGGFFFTDCEPEGARKWFPCYDSPSDKATVELTATVPANVKLGSNGKLQDSTINGTFITYHWKSRDQVATYLVVISSRINYKLDIVNWINPNTNDTIPMRFYYNSSENPKPMESIIGDMTSFYSEEFGDHPFEKNGFATLNNEFAWGGMENQTLTSLCPNCWQTALLAHEFAHQWFGDMITCATWADIFLNEGFATWTEAHYTEHVSGYAAYKDEIDGNASYYISANPGWAICEPSWAVNTPDVNTLFDYAVTYMKGSCVLHQLRYVLGDSLYFAGLKSYASDTVNFKYKSATIPQFRDKMEEVSGKDLDWFFDEWIFTANHPIYQNVYSIKDIGDGKWWLSVKMKQQMSSTYWQMPVVFKIQFEGLQDTTISVFNSVNNEIFNFTFDKKPIAFTFDPNNDIVLKQGTTVLENVTPDAVKPELSVFPTPFTDLFTLVYDAKNLNPSSFDIIDMSGHTVYSQNIIPQKGVNNIEINGSNLKSGIYFLRLKTKEAVLTTKIIK